MCPNEKFRLPIYTRMYFMHQRKKFRHLSKNTFALKEWQVVFVINEVYTIFGLTTT